MKQENIEAEGIVTEELGNSMFRVKLSSGHDVICTISGKIRKFYVRVMCGDKVKIEMSPYDLTRGRITFRYPPKTSPDAVVNNSINNKNNKKKR